MARAKEAAGDKDVLVHGATVAQLALAAGVLDEIQIHLSPSSSARAAASSSTSAPTTSSSSRSGSWRAPASPTSATASAAKEKTMTTYTIDWFMTLDGFGSGPEAYWGKDGPELREQRARTYGDEDQTLVFGANTYRLMQRFAPPGTIPATRP